MDQEEGGGQTFQARRRGCRKFRKPKTVCIFRNEKQNGQGGRGKEDVDISRNQSQAKDLIPSPVGTGDSELKCPARQGPFASACHTSIEA